MTDPPQEDNRLSAVFLLRRTVELMRGNAVPAFLAPQTSMLLTTAIAFELALNVSLIAAWHAAVAV